MTGRLIQIPGPNFCVTYKDRSVYVRWWPGDAANERKPAAWIKEALPGWEQVPENMLRDLIGSEARFQDTPRFEERKVELLGELDDGGQIRLGYCKGTPPQALSESERADAAETLQQWAHSHLRSDPAESGRRSLG
jgi:hypothetical protein